MKKLTAWMLAVCLLTACSAASVYNVKNDPPPESTAFEKPQAAREISYTVEMDVWADSALDEDGTPLASYRFQLPMLTARRADGTAVTEPQTEEERQALATAEAFNTKFGKWAAAEEFPEIVSAAREERAWFQSEGMEWPGSDGTEAGGYALELTCTVYQTDTLISVSGEYYSYTGGAHPNTWLLGWNFDLAEGVFFQPDLLAESTGLQEAVMEEIIRQANEPRQNGTIPAEDYWEDYREIAANWSSYAVSFDESGMTVAFSPYELASYAAGTQSFRIAYGWLAPYLSEHGREILGLDTPRDDN